MDKADRTKRARPVEAVQECADGRVGLVRAVTSVVDALDFRVAGRTKFKASEIALITLCSIASGGTSVALRAKCLSIQQPVFSGQSRLVADRWLMAAETLRPKAAPGPTCRPESSTSAS